MSDKFKVGDRVVATANWCGATIKGLYATVRAAETFACGVEFDADFYYENDPTCRCGHNLRGEISNERGLWIPDDCLELAKQKDPLEDIWDDFAKHMDELIAEAVGESKRVSKPPKLSYADALKCLIASHTYPYAVLDTDGTLYFYSDVPKGVAVFKTATVKVSL